MAQGDWQHLCSSRTQVRSLPQLSELMDPAFFEMGTGMSPVPQKHHMPWGNQKKKKKKKAYQSSLFIWQDGNHSQIKKK